MSIAISRLRIVVLLCVLGCAVLLVRLYFLQVVQGDDFASRADRQYLRPSQGLFDRGDIFFEDKNGQRTSAATLNTGFTISINPQHISDPQKAYELLSSVVPLDKDVFIAQATKKDDPYEEIAHHVSQKDIDTITAFEINGVQIHKDQWRYYPGKSLAAHTIGFVAFRDNDTLTGQYGLERYYNDVLSRDTEGVYGNFFAEIFSNVSDVSSDVDSARNGNIVTTLDPYVQTLLEKTLSDVVHTWHSRSTAGIIINPQTGAIVAMGRYPTFDLNTFQESAPGTPFGNPLVENVFEMGSIIKPLTVAAGLDTGVITPQTTYEDMGTIVVDGARISNYDGRARGVVDMQQILSQSLNTGVAFITRKLGNKKFSDYFYAYKLGEETGIDLPGEVHGLVSNLDSPRDVEHVTASFGQGIALTPIATVRALAALGNGGLLVTPHVVDKIVYDVGLTKTIAQPPGIRVLKQTTSEAITKMLVRVVDEALVGGTLKQEHYSIAAKTGTAQISRGNGGGYYDDRFFHSFFGYFPAYDPQFLIFLYNEEPKDVKFASQTLAEPFMTIVKSLIQYYEIPPDR